MRRASNAEVSAARSTFPVADRLLEPGRPKNPRGTDGRASVPTRPRRTSPVVLGRIDCARAHRRTVERTNIPDPNAGPQQRIQMDVDLGRGIDRYVDILIADHVLGNDCATNGRD